MLYLLSFGVALLLPSIFSELLQASNPLSVYFSLFFLRFTTGLFFVLSKLMFSRLFLAACCLSCRRLLLRKKT